MDKSQWDTMDWWDWLDTLSEDAVVTELMCQHNQLTAIRSLVREMGKFVLYVAVFPEKYMAIPDRDLPFEAQRLLERPEVKTIMEKKG